MVFVGICPQICLVCAYWQGGWCSHPQAASWRGPGFWKQGGVPCSCSSCTLKLCSKLSHEPCRFIYEWWLMQWTYHCTNVFVFVFLANLSMDYFHKWGHNLMSYDTAAILVHLLVLSIYHFISCRLCLFWVQTRSGSADPPDKPFHQVDDAEHEDPPISKLKYVD